VSWSRDHDFESWKKCRKKEPCISCSSQGILARIITGKYVFWINVWFFPSYVQANHLQNINYHFPIPIHPSNRPTTHPLIPIIPSSSQFICCSFLYTFRSSFSPLLGGINDVSSGDLAFVHQVVHLLEFTHANRFVWGLDESASEELDGLG